LIALEQLQCDILLVDWDTFHKAVEHLLDRSVWTHEFGLCREELIKEAKLAYCGKRISKDKRDDAIAKGFEKLQDRQQQIIGVGL
jgi:hypothetical protein